MAKKSSRARLWLFRILKMIMVILPLVILLIIRFDKYVYSKPAAQGLTIGGCMAVGVIALTALGQLKLRGLGWSILFLVMAYFLKSVLDDLLLILLCVVIGQVVSRIFELCEKHEEEQIIIERSAQASAVQTEEIIKKYHNSGRV